VQGRRQGVFGERIKRRIGKIDQDQAEATERWQIIRQNHAAWLRRMREMYPAITDVETRELN
jgi:hypothetical protein